MILGKTPEEVDKIPAALDLYLSYSIAKRWSLRRQFL